MSHGTTKLSASHLSVPVTMSCSPRYYTEVTQTYPWGQKMLVFGIRKIEFSDYVDELTVPFPGPYGTTYVGTYNKYGDYLKNKSLYEIQHNYIGTNDLTNEGPFDYDPPALRLGELSWDISNPEYYYNTLINLEGFPSGSSFSGYMKVIKSYSTSSIVMFSNPVEIPTEFGYLLGYKPYGVKSKFTLTCTTELIPVRITPTVTVNLGTLEIPWTVGEEYTIEVGEGFVKHTYGDKYSNPSFSVPFTTNTNPDLLSWSPINNPLSGNIHYALVKYPRKIFPSIGNIKLYKNGTTLVETFLPGDSRVEFITTTPFDRLYPNSYSVKINVINLLETNQDYHITFENNVGIDLDNFPTVAITDPEVINFTVAIPDYIYWEPGNVTATENNRSVKIVYPYIVTPLEGTTGTIRFYNSNGDLLRTFDPNGTEVSYYSTSPGVPGYPYSTTVELDVLGLLKENSTYYVLIDASVFDNVDGFQNFPVDDVMELRYSTDDSDTGLFPGLKSSIVALSGLSDTGERLRLNQAALQSSVTISANIESYVIASSNQVCTFSTSINGQYLKRGRSNQTATMTISCLASANSKAKSTMSAVASIIIKTGYVFEQIKTITAPISRVFPENTFGYYLDATPDASYIAISSPNVWQTSLSGRAGEAYMYYNYSNQAIIVSNDLQFGDRFGEPISISKTGDYLAIGAPGEDNVAPASASYGAVYIFTRSGTSWTQQTKIENTFADKDTGDFFGRRVKINQDGTYLVTTRYKAGSGTQAYVYFRTGTTWELQETFDGSVLGFGSILNVEISDDATYLALQHSSGAAIYTRSGNAWTLQQNITGATSDSEFEAFAMNPTGTHIAIGEITYSNLRGRVKVYRRTGTTWSLQTTLLASNGTSYDYFGSAISITPDGTRIVVGAPGYQPITNNKIGACYVYTRNGSTWVENMLPQTLVSIDSRMGQSVKITDNDSHIIVGIPGIDNTSYENTGMVRVYAINAA